MTVSEKKVQSVSVSALPTKTAYLDGERLNVSGGELEVTYSDGSKETVAMTEDMVVGGPELTGASGKKTVRLSVSGIEAEFEVTLSYRHAHHGGETDGGKR